MNPVIPLVLALRLSALTEVLHISCNMGTRDLPEMYARSPWTQQITHAHVTTIKYKNSQGVKYCKAKVKQFVKSKVAAKK